MLTLFLAAASAQDVAWSHSGRVLDAAGEPVDGVHTLGGTLYDDATAGTALWTR